MRALAVLFGMFLWAATTVIAFVAGTWLFAGTLLTLVAYLAVVPLVWVVFSGFARITLVMPGDRLAAAALIVVPGLVMNAGLMLVEPTVFAWPAAVERGFASWLMWTYAATLIVAARADRAAVADPRDAI